MGPPHHQCDMRMCAGCDGRVPSVVAPREQTVAESIALARERVGHVLDTGQEPQLDGRGCLCAGCCGRRPRPGRGTPGLSIEAAEATSTPVWVPADAETVPVPSPATPLTTRPCWRNPEDPSASLVIGNNKLGGLEVYGLDGSRRQRITTGTTFWGNVDVRQGVQIGGTTRDVVAAMNGGLRMFAVDPVALQLTPTTEGSGSVNTGGGEGLCLYQSSSTGSLYAVVITIAGRVRHYVITDADLDGLLDASLVREFQVGSEGRDAWPTTPQGRSTSPRRTSGCGATARSRSPAPRER